MLFLTILFLILLGCILTNSGISLSYARLGLELWFQNMIPTLLPFMILSGIMIRMKLTDKAAMVIYPVAGPVFKIRKTVCYAMLTGFLCGFPMGARVVDDLYRRRMVTKREAEYLLAFCNNIGPVYFCSFVLPLLGRKQVLPYLFGMYGIPLLYGIVLRFTVYRDLSGAESDDLSGPELVCCESFSARKPGRKSVRREESLRKRGFFRKEALLRKESSLRKGGSLAERFLEETDQSIQASVQNILSLGGYMILYNLLNLVPHIVLGHPLTILSPLLEITGGLILLGNSLPFYSLLALSFGGLSCIAQTYHCIGSSDLSIGRYVLHKAVLTMLNGGFYLCWYLFFPTSFLC